MSVSGQQAAIELETFLPPQEGTEVKSFKGESTAASQWNNRQISVNHNDRGRWDPFKDRDTQPHGTTNCDTLTHLLKAALGTGIISMPIAFKFSGLLFGIIATIVVSIICTHCSYIVVKCAHELYHRTRVSAMTFADVGEIAFASGPPWGKKFSKLARVCIEGGLIAAYFGACSAYCVFIAKSLQKVFEHYFAIGYSIRSYIVSLWIPLILLCWIPNLKKLTPISMVANVLMAVGLILTFYFLVWDLHSVSEMPKMAPLHTIPHFFSITIFALEVIGVVMPLENAMKTPKKFVGLCGVLNQGMSGVTLLFIFLGFLGYLKYGENTKESITFNLPMSSILAQIVQICVAVAMFCTYGLQYFVFLEIIWNGIKDKFKNTRAAEYAVRTILTSCTVILAIAIPTITPFIGLIGALCFSFLGLMIPVIIEIITYWDKGFGPCYWLLWKSMILFLFGLFAMFTGSYVNILEIVKIYKN